jgi:hypothetical protein
MSQFSNTSFALMAPDGTGIGTMAFTNDTSSGVMPKGGGLLVDSGSNYDGLYFSTPTDLMSNWVTDAETYFCAFDSFRGKIAYETSVEEDREQAAFSVSQNMPNPFNPQTSISFTVPKDAAVSVDIYNATGQKVKSLLNGSMKAGTHSVVWDASGFSAGVYFCTVKAGTFSKTIKMTLLK